jgi:hypothetical protein
MGIPHPLSVIPDVKRLCFISILAKNRCGVLVFYFIFATFNIFPALQGPHLTGHLVPKNSSTTTNIYIYIYIKFIPFKYIN